MFLKKMTIFAITCFAMLNGALFSYSDTSSINGNEIIVWDTFTPLGFDILASVQIGGSYSSAVTIGDPVNDPRVPKASINSSDQIVAVWIGYDAISGVQSLFAASYQSGVWSLSTIISDPLLEQVQSEYWIKVADNGTVVVTWKSYLFSTGNFVMRGMYSSTFGTWTTPVTIL